MKFNSLGKALTNAAQNVILRAGLQSCVLCAIAKNETAFVQEWAAFHLAIGFDRIVIYDNESTDDLGKAFRSGRWPVEVIAWPTKAGYSPQGPAYKDFVFSRGRSSGWVAFLDLDEFLNLKKHASVKDFLADYPSADAIGINWRIFGSSNHQLASQGLVIDRFQRAAPSKFEIHNHIKTIARRSKIREVGIHSPVLQPGAQFISPDRTPRVNGRDVRQDYIDFSIAQINHYFTKSREEFELKRLRGRADLPPEAPKRTRSAEEFIAYDRNEDVDKSILRWRSATMLLLDKMR